MVVDTDEGKVIAGGEIHISHLLQSSKAFTLMSGRRS